LPLKKSLTAVARGGLFIVDVLDEVAEEVLKGVGGLGRIGRGKSDGRIELGPVSAGGWPGRRRPAPGLAGQAPGAEETIIFILRKWGPF